MPLRESSLSVFSVSGTNSWCSPDELQILVPLINQSQAEKVTGLEDLTKVYLDRVLDYMITQVCMERLEKTNLFISDFVIVVRNIFSLYMRNICVSFQISKIEWLDKSTRKKGFECLFYLFKKYYLHHVFPMWTPRTNLYATNPGKVGCCYWLLSIRMSRGMYISEDDSEVDSKLCASSDTYLRPKVQQACCRLVTLQSSSPYQDAFASLAPV